MKKASRKTPAARKKRPASKAVDDDMRPEYDFSAGVRGKYAGRFATGQIVRVVVLAPDVAETFRSARAVNAALRRVLKDRSQASGTRRPRSRRTA